MGGGRLQSPKPASAAGAAGSAKCALPPPPPKPAAGRRPARRVAAVERRLGTVDEVPEYQRKPYIKRYYRLERPQWCHFWRVHNETGNIWTHVLAAIFSAGRLAQWCWSVYSTHWGAIFSVSGPEGFYVAGISAFFAWAVAIFGISVQYHWRHCSTEDEHNRWLCLDMSGCMALVVLGYAVGIPLGFHCFPSLRLFYICMSGAVLTGVGLALWVRSRSRALQCVSAATLIICGALVALVPAAHWLWVSAEGRRATGRQLMWAIFLALQAATVYSRHIPECCAPGRFDLMGHSHQIWHVLIFFVIMLYGECLVAVFELTRPGPGGTDSPYCSAARA